MTDISLPEPGFVIEDAPELAQTDLTTCMLFMNVGHEQLAYTIYNPAKRCFISLKSYYFETGRIANKVLEILEQCFDTDKMLYIDFKEIRLSFDYPEFTLVPAEKYDKKLKSRYLSLLYPEQPDQVFLRDPVRKPNAVNVYSLNKNVAGYLKKEFGKAHIYHSETAVLNTLMQQKETAEHRVYVRVLPKRITLTILSGDRLLMMQPYAIHHEMDALYYVLNAINQFNLPFGKTEIRLYGDIDENSPVYQKLHFEADTISWLARPGNFNYVDTFNRFPDHYFYNLVSLALCES